MPAWSFPHSGGFATRDAICSGGTSRQNGDASPLAETRPPPRPSRGGKGDPLAGLLACGSGLGRAFPDFAHGASSGMFRPRSPLTVAGAAAESHRIPSFLCSFDAAEPKAGSLLAGGVALSIAFVCVRASDRGSRVADQFSICPVAMRVDSIGCRCVPVSVPVSVPQKHRTSSRVQ